MLEVAILLMAYAKVSKTLTKHISCQCKFDGRKCNSNQLRNNDKCWCECKKHYTCEKYYIWNPTTCSPKYSKYSARIIDDLVIACDKITDGDAEAWSYDEETKTIPKNIIFGTNFLYFICLCINYNCIADRCQYLLLSDKI